MGNKHKTTTHVLMVVDRSGSMARLADEVRSGFNNYVESLRADTAMRYRLTAVLFNATATQLCTAAKLKVVPRLDEHSYRPSGMTALADAIGLTITSFETATSLGKGDRVLLVVTTDGQENASQEYSTGQVAEMIRERETTGKWSAVYLGAGPAAWEQAAGFGFQATQTVHVGTSREHTRHTYDSLSTATRLYSRGASGAETAATVAEAAGENPQDND